MKASAYINISFVVWLFTLFFAGPYFLEGRTLMAFVITVLWGFVAGACLFDEKACRAVDETFNKEKL